MNKNTYSMLNGKDPKALNDIIELNDGTRIKSIILNVSNDEVKYFNTRNETREKVPAEAINMLYLDDATISIPFPLSAPTRPKKQSMF